MPNSESDVTLTGDGVLRFDGAAEPVSWWVQGQPITSSQRYKKRDEYHDWKVRVACAVKEMRRHRWDPAHRYAITLQFRFAKRQHRDHEPDLDNCVKPVLDGLKEGLGVDDRRFRTLLIRHLYVNSEEEEGVCIFVSTADSPANTEAPGQSGRDYLR